MPDAGPGERASARSTHSSGTLPAGLTPAAAEAFRDVEEEFREGLSAELRRRRRQCPDLTTDDVYEARAIVAHAMREPGSPNGSGRSGPPVAGAHRRGGSLVAPGRGLMAIGSVGVAAMHPYLHSSWQVTVLVLLIAVGLTGVGMTWRGGRSGGTRDAARG